MYIYKQLKDKVLPWQASARLDNNILPLQNLTCLSQDSTILTVDYITIGVFNQDFYLGVILYVLGTTFNGGFLVT